MATKTTNTAEANLKDNAPEGMALSDSELAAARKDGSKQDATEVAKETHRFLTDGNLPGTPPNTRWLGSDEILPWAFYLDGSLDAIKEAVKAGGIPDNKLYGLLALERNGQNRTDYVSYMVDQLGLKKDLEEGQSLAAALPGGGPDYTNDTTSLSKL
jgi:hypothetical protein